MRTSLLFFFTSFLAACSGWNSDRDTYATIHGPSAGSATVIGRVVNTSGQPYQNLTVRLAEVYYATDNPEQGAYVLDAAFSLAGLRIKMVILLFLKFAPYGLCAGIRRPDSAYKMHRK